jgi:hypothetical protein
MATAGSMRICYATKAILTTTWIISIVIPSNMAEYNEWSTGRIRVFIDLWSRVFTRLTGDILVISVFMQMNDSNDALHTSAHPLALTRVAISNHQCRQ